MSGRRLLVLLVVLAAIGVPAGILRAACAGRSCSAGDDEPARVPFCPLSEELRTALSNGYREGRSPDVLAVARPDVRVAGPGDLGTGLVPWPSADGEPTTAVPIVFAGAGLVPGARVPDGVTLDRIAPTIAEAIGLERAHPDVRSGTPIPGVAGREAPTLVLLVAWKGVGSQTLEAQPGAWPFLRILLGSGAGTTEGDTGSLPLDPAATLTTIGTGGLPSQHGITGSFVRNEEGETTRAFGERAPLPIIAALGDDLDEANANRSRVGLVASDVSDAGLIGGRWYLDHDRDDVRPASGPGSVAEVRRLLHDGYGADELPDVLAVALDGDLPSMDRRTRAIVAAAERATAARTLVVVAGTGELADEAATASSAVVRAVEEEVSGEGPVIDAVVPGGLFLDQGVLTEQGLTGQAVVDALLSMTDARGRPMMQDAFQGFAVSFARYC